MPLPDRKHNNSDNWFSVLYLIFLQIEMAARLNDKKTHALQLIIICP